MADSPVGLRCLYETTAAPQAVPKEAMDVLTACAIVLVAVANRGFGGGSLHRGGARR